jgi:hypothetical protein
MRRALVMAALAALGAPRPADACSCGPPRAFSSELPEQLPVDPVLYAWVPTDAVLTLPVVTQEGASREVTVEVVSKLDEVEVRRLTIRGATPGQIAIDGATHTITEAPPPRPPAALLGADYHDAPAMGGDCGEGTGYDVWIDGPPPAAYRMRWKDDETGAAREAILPASAEGDEHGMPVVPPRHHLRLSSPGMCGVALLPVTMKGDRYRDAELAMLGFDGSEVVVARGDLVRSGRWGQLPRFAPPPPPPPPPPAAAPPPAPPPAKEGRWRIVVGAGGGFLLGGLLGFLLRRRS